jgi:hypothetical protein
MLYILRSGLSAGTAAVWMMSMLLVSNGSVQAEERRNWLKAPSRPASDGISQAQTRLRQLFPRSLVSVSARTWRQVGDVGVQD